MADNGDKHSPSLTGQIQEQPSVETTPSFSHPLEQYKSSPGSSPSMDAARPPAGAVSGAGEVGDGTRGGNQNQKSQLPNAPTASPGSRAGSMPVVSGIPGTENRSINDQEVDLFFTSHDESRELGVSFYPSPLLEIPFGVRNSKMYGKVIQLGHSRQWHTLLTTSSIIFSGDTREGDAYGPLLQRLLASNEGEAIPHDRVLIKELAIILYFRWVAMVKLKRYGELKNEVDRVQMRIADTESDDDTSEGGAGRHFSSWVPTGLKIAAILTLHHTDPQICADTLHLFIDELDYPASSDSDERNQQHWILRSQASLSNVLVRQLKWRMALQCLDKALAALDIVSCVTSSALDNLLRLGIKIELISRQGRILLQIGAVDEAQELFHIVESKYFGFLSQQLGTVPLAIDAKTRLRQMPIRNAYTNILLNKGLLFFAREQYPRAMEQFNLAVDESRAVNSERDTFLGSGNLQDYPQQRVLNQMALTQDLCMLSMDDSKDGALSYFLMLDPPEDQCSHLSTSDNNMALCALYSCQMRKAVHILEVLIRENPSMNMTEVLTFNLCTLYELGSDNATSGKKKRTLQLIATRFGLQDIPQESFRIG